MNGHGMANDDKIARARNLLKKFQSKQQQENKQHGESSITPSINGSEASSVPQYPLNINNNAGILQSDNNSSSCNDSICNDGIKQMSCNSSRPPSSIGTAAPNTNDLSLIDNYQFEQFRCHSIPKSTSDSGQIVEINTLRNSLKAKERELADALHKHQSLQTHYANLHSAYTQLVNKKSLVMQAEVSPAHIQQIQQLQTALAASLDEKTALQAELRELKNRLESFSEQHQLAISSSQSTISSTTNDELETRLNKLFVEKEKLLETISKQCTQIEQQRKECSGLEAKWVLIQQDRLDTQARLKNIFKEKAQLERNLEQMKQELGMRDIYLRQLTSHNKDNEQQQFFTGSNNAFISSIKFGADNKKQLEEEIQQYKNELTELNKQMQAAKQHYHDTTNQANARIQQLENELGQLRSKMVEMEYANNFLQEQLLVQHEHIQDGSPEHEDAQPSIEDSNTILQLKHQLSDMSNMNEKYMHENGELTQLIEKKNSELDLLKEELAERIRRILELEHYQNIQSTINTDAATLSIQLQNEKATVSRAVAQNLELKAQLTELQNRLIEVINESAVKEDERVTALASVARLTQLLNEKKLQLQQNKQQFSSNGEHTVCLNQENREDPDLGMIDESINNSDSHDDQNMKLIDVNERCSIGIQTDEFQQIDPEISDSFKDQLPIERNGAVEDDDKNELEGTNTNTVSAHNYGAVETNTGHGEDSNTGQIQEQLHQQQLQQRLDQLYKENQQYRENNVKLEYWMTALESENESIGEYISLYRFQRGNIQKKIAEKDQQLRKLQQQNTILMSQLAELHNSTMAYLDREGKKQQQSYNELVSEENKRGNLKTPDDLVNDNQMNGSRTEQSEVKNPCGIVQENYDSQQHSNSNEMHRLIRALEKSKILGNEVVCSAAQEAQIHCTGCIECRGEMFTL